MAVTTLTVQTTARTGISLTNLAVAPDLTLGCRFPNTGGQTLVVINGGVGACVATLVYGSGAVYDGVAIANRTVSIPAGKTLEIGPFSPGAYNDLTTGYMTVTFDQVTSVTVVARQNGT